MGVPADRLRRVRALLQRLTDAAEKHGLTLGDLARHPLTGGVLNVVGVIAGIFGAIVADDVKNYVASFWTDPPPEYDSKAIAYFGGASFALVVLFALRQWAIDRQRRRDHLAMQRIAERIQSTVRTHPPAEFMQELGIAIEKSFVIGRSASTDDQRQTAIRLILNHVAELAQTFEGSASIRAGANLMIFLRREDPVSALWQQWYANIQFFDGDPAGLEGMLVLSPRLSAVPDGSGGSDPALREDSRITPLALPVPSDPGGPSPKRLWNVLPGAPMAFVRNRPTIDVR